MPVITIIIPVYNADLYIEECLDSIRRQTIKDIEIIIIDDGSTDNTCNIVKKYMESDSRIVLLYQQHAGSGAARNKGLKEATGKYVAFCDADDYYYDENALERMVNACEHNNVPVCGSYRIMIDNGIIKDSNLFRNVGELGEEGRSFTFADYQNDYDYQSFIFSRKMLADNNINFPDYLRYQDPPFLLKALTSIEKFWVVPVYMYVYREGHQNKKANRQKIKHTLTGIKENLKIALEYGYDRLFEVLIEERINGQFIEDIMENMSSEVNELLDEIVELCNSCRKHVTIKALEDYMYYNDCIDLISKEDVITNMYSSHSQEFGLWRKIALLYYKGYDFGVIAERMGLESIYVYGAGEIGNLFIESIREYVEIKSVIDKKYENNSDYISDDVPIVITPISLFQRLSYEMIKSGMDRKRIYSINTLLAIGLKYIESNPDRLPVKCQILITGIDFGIEDAYMCLKEITDNIRIKYKDAVIWVLPKNNYPVKKEEEDKLDVLFLIDGYELKSQLYEVLTQLDFIIDAGDECVIREKECPDEKEYNLRIDRISDKYGIPIYQMGDDSHLYRW